MTDFSTCRSMSDVLGMMASMPEPQKQGMGDKFALVGVNARGAEFITFLDRPVVHKAPKGYDKLIIYKEHEVIR